MLPTSFSLALTIVLALAPGLLAWWTGRTILAKADDPVLPELLVEREKRLEIYALIGGLAIAFQFVDRALWALPLLWLTLGLSFRPLRRSLYGERLSAPAFLRYFIFSAIGQLGPWLLARCAPALVVSFALEMAPNDHAAAVRLALWSGLLSAAIIVLWKYYYSRVFLDLHRATPLRSSARPELMAKLDAVLEKAAPALARLPEVYRYGAPGAYVMNASAIPSSTHPAVALGDTLLATMTDDEIAAVYAHEIAHHERFNTKRSRRARWRFLLIIAIAAGLPILLVSFLPVAAVAVAWCLTFVWLLVAASWTKRTAPQRNAETACDVRAVTLTGNAEAVISALTKLHVYSRLPRRWPHSLEQAASHPSLARRIQALRKMGGAIEHPGAEVANPLTAVRSTVAGSVVAFDRDRAYWFEGISTDTPLELHALRDAASSYRAFAYGDLTELRVGVANGERSIDATDREGRSWRVVIRPNDVDAVHGVLDRVDIRLGRKRRTVVVASATGIRWLIVALFVSLTSSLELVGMAILPMLVVLFRPTWTAAVVATAAMAIARVLVALPHLSADPIRQAGFLVAVAIAVFLIVHCVRRVRIDEARGHGRRMTREALTAAGLLGLLAAILAAAVWRLVDGQALSLIGNPVAVASATALFAAGSSLMTSPNRWWRGGGAFASLAALLGGVLLSGDGWPAHRTPPIEWRPGRLTAIGAVRIAGGGQTLATSPSGRAFAVTQFQTPRRSESAVAGPRYVIGRFEDSARVIRTSTASKIAFLDDETLVAIDTAAGDSLELRAERVVPTHDSVAVLWRERMPGMDEPELFLDRVHHAWLVVGRGNGDGSSFTIVRDTLGGTKPRLQRYSNKSIDEIASLPLAGFADGGTIWSTMSLPRGRSGVLLAMLLASTQTLRSEVHGMDASGEHRVVEVSGFPACATELDERGALCLEQSANGLHVWRAASARTFTRVADLPPADLVRAKAPDRVAEAERDGPRIVVLDVDRRVGHRLTIPAGSGPRKGWWTADVAARADYVLVLTTSGRDRAIVSRYEIR